MWLIKTAYTDFYRYVIFSLKNVYKNLFLILQLTLQLGPTLSRTVLHFAFCVVGSRRSRGSETTSTRSDSHVEPQDEI